MGDETKCCICGTAEGVNLWLMGPYRMNACDECGRNSPALQDGFGNRPLKYEDIEARRFSEAMADMIKALIGGR